MSGICGVLALGSERGDRECFATGLCDHLVRELLCMGRDGSNRWAEEDVSLGHVMLRETPESASESQPLLSSDDRLVMVFDGRIDNRPALFSLIEESVAIVPRNCSDAELALRVYQVLGNATPTKLLGDFAFAVWNRAERSLFLARDPVGGRLLYFVQTKDYFAFASRDEALLALPGITSAPNYELVLHAFAPPIPKPSQSMRGWYRDIMRFPFGHVAEIKAGSPSLRLWRYPPWCPVESTYPSTFEEAVKAVAELLALATADRMRACNIPAMLMSGGIDSASVIAAMREVIPATPTSEKSRIVGLSLVDEGNECCVETAAIVHLHEHFHTEPIFVSTRASVGAQLKAHLMQQFFDRAHPQDNSNVTLFPLFLRAREQGLTSVLTGAGGDIVSDRTGAAVAGVWRSHGLWQAWNMARALSRNNVYLRETPSSRIFLQGCRGRIATWIPRWLKRVLRWFASRPIVERNPFFDRKALLRLLDARESGPGTMHYLGAEPSSPESASNSARRQMLRAVGEGQDMLQHAASRYGITASDVWSDLRLINFFLRLPLALSCNDGWTKAPVRAFLTRSGVKTRVAYRLGKEHIGSDLLRPLQPAIRAFSESVLTKVGPLGVIDAKRLETYFAARESITNLPSSPADDAAEDLVDATAAVAFAAWVLRT